MKKRVLVTGSEGFTGKYLTAELNNFGYEVFGVGRGSSTSKNYTQVDLLDLESLSSSISKIRPDIVIHLAAVAFVGHGDVNDFYRINLIGTRNLLDAISELEKIPEHILLSSSANVYGNQAEGKLNETTSPSPSNDYATSKLAMEYMAKTWLPKLPISIVRPFNYTGVGQSVNFLIPKIISHFQRRLPVIELGNIDVFRDFSDVRAFARAYRKLIELKPIGETFNLSSGITYSLKEIIELCEQLTEHKIQIIVNPNFVRKNEVKSLCGDSSKLISYVGDWENPSLATTIQWMLSSNQ